MSQLATIQREGYTVPLLGIPFSAVLEDCDLCGESVPLADIQIQFNGQKLCPKCRQQNQTKTP